MIREPANVTTHAPHLAKQETAGDAPMELPPGMIRIDGNAMPPATWDELHLWGLAPARRDDPLWLMTFGWRIPGGCQCTKHWRGVLAHYEPRFDDKFAWTVDVHNAVNRHLDKPQLELEEARAIWTARHDEINRQQNLKAS